MSCGCVPLSQMISANSIHLGCVLWWRAKQNVAREQLTRGKQGPGCTGHAGLLEMKQMLWVLARDRVGGRSSWAGTQQLITDKWLEGLPNHTASCFQAPWTCHPMLSCVSCPALTLASCPCMLRSLPPVCPVPVTARARVTML